MKVEVIQRITHDDGFGGESRIIEKKAESKDPFSNTGISAWGAKTAQGDNGEKEARRLFDTINPPPAKTAIAGIDVQEREISISSSPSFLLQIEAMLEPMGWKRKKLQTSDDPSTLTVTLAKHTNDDDKRDAEDLVMFERWKKNCRWSFHKLPGSEDAQLECWSTALKYARSQNSK